MARTPSPGRWLLVAAAALALAGVALLAYGSYRGLFVAPPERHMGNVQRIMYVHVPTAWTALLALTCAFVCALGSLWFRRPSFDAFLEKYKLDDPVLHALALIVRGADTDQRDLTPESAGLYAYATGFQATSKDDFENMQRQFPAYDALYAYCRSKVTSKG